MAIIVGIDGTDDSLYDGKERDERYDKNFAKSFVRQIAFGRGGGSLYERGPLMHGGNLDMAIANAKLHVLREINRGNRGPVLLTGYSRGAAGVVQLATVLGRMLPNPVTIEAMLLFDCVNRHTSIESAFIPNNVRNVLHVIRDPKAASREGFGNSGLEYNPAFTNYEPLRPFKCTHGGMGGCPWSPDFNKGQTWGDLIDEGIGLPHRSGIKTPFGTIPTLAGDGLTTVTFAEDHRVSATVWDSCQTFLKKHGFR